VLDSLEQDLFTGKLVSESGDALRLMITKRGGSLHVSRRADSLTEVNPRTMQRW
jgi:hypothetical protein